MVDTCQPQAVLKLNCIQQNCDEEMKSDRNEFHKINIVVIKTLYTVWCGRDGNE